MKDDRVWVSIPMDPDMQARIAKAAAKNSMSRSEYLRMAIRSHMERASEWTLMGRKKGS